MRTPAFRMAEVRARPATIAAEQTADVLTGFSPSVSFALCPSVLRLFVSPRPSLPSSLPPFVGRRPAECFCGASLNLSGDVGTKTTDSACQTFACSGDGSQSCGGSYRLLLYKGVSAPATPSLPSGWQAQGCTSLLLSGKAQ